MSEIAGPVDRVVVVGAGIAGLAAASRLRQAGIACVVLEARDRIGGRLYTIDLAGTPVDLGGSWIHHPIGNPVTVYCDEHGIARDGGDPVPSLSAYDHAEGRRLDRAEVERYAVVESEAFWDAVEELSQRLGPQASAYDAIETHIADRGLAGDDARRVHQELLAEVEADAADRADNQSLRWIAVADLFEGDLFGDLPRNGYRSVVDRLAAGLDVRLNAEVVDVVVGADGVRVTCADGSIEACSHVDRHGAARCAQAGQPAIRPATARADAAGGRLARVRPLREDRAALRVAVLARRRHLTSDRVPH